MLSDLAYALRASRSAPAFIVFVVGLLALGIGANTAIFSVLHAVLLRPLDYPEPDRLYEIAGTTARGVPTQIVPGAFEALRQGARTLENSALMRVRPFTILGDGGAESIYGQALAGDGLQVFGTAPIAGRLFAAGSSREVVLSHRLWVHRYQAAPSIVGRVVNLNGESYTVVGVMPPGFETANRPIVDLWLPWTFTTQELAERSAGGFPMVARRKGTASEAETHTEIATLGQVFERDLPSEQKGWSATLTPLKESRVGQHRATLWVLLGAVGFVLLIACLNVACLMMERALDRKKEVAVRLALGASRWRLVRQFLVESSLISAAAGVVGLSVAWWGTRAVIALSPSRPLLPRLDQTSVDGWVLLFNFSVAAVVSLTFGLAPVWQVARITPRDGLQDYGRGFAGSRASQRARGFAVTLQAALSLVLLAGAGLMLRTFVNLIHVDPGFRPEGVLTVRIPSGTGRGNEVRLAGGYASILERTRALPGVQAAALTTVLPLGPVEATTTMAAESAEVSPGQVTTVQYRAVSPGYFRTMGIPLLRGRDFEEADTASAAEVAIVNNVAARRYWPGEDSIGKRVATTFDAGKPVWMTVVGVVGGVRQSTLMNEPDEELYRPYNQHFFGVPGAVLLARTDGDPESLAGPVSAMLRERFPNQPLAEVRTMAQWVEHAIARPRFDVTLLAAFALIALAVAATGIYGLVSYEMRSRRREIGIRMALGARPRQVSAMVLRQGVWLVAPGLIIGVVVALHLTRVLSAQLYGVEPNDALSLAASCALLFFTSLLASWLPSSRAARVNPAETLRTE